MKSVSPPFDRIAEKSRSPDYRVEHVFERSQPPVVENVTAPSQPDSEYDGN